MRGGGDAARQAVRPSGGRGVCVVQRGVHHGSRIHSQTHTSHRAHRHTNLRALLIRW